MKGGVYVFLLAFFFSCCSALPLVVNGTLQISSPTWWSSLNVSDVCVSGVLVPRWNGTGSLVATDCSIDLWILPNASLWIHGNFRFQNINVQGTIHVVPYDGTTGTGSLNLVASQNVTVSGWINGNGRGYGGGGGGGSSGYEWESGRGGNARAGAGAGGTGGYSAGAYCGGFTIAGAISYNATLTGAEPTTDGVTSTCPGGNNAVTGTRGGNATVARGGLPVQETGETGGGGGAGGGPYGGNGGVGGIDPPLNDTSGHHASYAHALGAWNGVTNGDSTTDDSVWLGSGGGGGGGHAACGASYSAGSTAVGENGGEGGQLGTQKTSTGTFGHGRCGGGGGGSGGASIYLYAGNTLRIGDTAHIQSWGTAGGTNGDGTGQPWGGAGAAGGIALIANSSILLWSSSDVSSITRGVYNSTMTGTHGHGTVKVLTPLMYLITNDTNNMTQWNIQAGRIYTVVNNIIKTLPEQPTTAAPTTTTPTTPTPTTTTPTTPAPTGTSGNGTTTATPTTTAPTGTSGNGTTTATPTTTAPTTSAPSGNGTTTAPPTPTGSPTSSNPTTVAPTSPLNATASPTQRPNASFVLAIHWEFVGLVGMLIAFIMQ